MHQISVQRVQPGASLGQTVYGGRGQVLARAGAALSARQIEQLQGLGVSSILIDDEETADLEFSAGIQETTRQQAYVFVEELLARLHEDHMGLRSEDITEAQGLADTMHREVMSSQARELNLMPPRTAAQYAIQHPVHVAVLGLVVGLGMRLTETSLRRMAAAALLMDIGQVWLPDGLLAKPDTFTDEETKRVREHPLRALAMIRQLPQFDQVIATSILLHHERWDGSGYPRGVKGEQIGAAARILAVADTYDALIAGATRSEERPDGEAWPPHMAMEFIMAYAGDTYDPGVADAFVSAVPSFPPGMLVRLDSGDQGVVVQANLGLPGRPAVRAHYGAAGERLAEPAVVDLSRPENQARSVASLLDDWEVAA